MMGFLKTLVVGTFAVLGGCTVVVGGCTVGAVKVGVETASEMVKIEEKTTLDKLYKESPARAEAKYVEVATECYSKYMQLKLGQKVPPNVIDERVNFDIYEIRTNQTGNQENIQYLGAWRKQSDKKIIASVVDKRQRSHIKKYLKKVNNGNLLETACIAKGLAPKTNKRPSPNMRQASARR